MIGRFDDCPRTVLLDALQLQQDNPQISAEAGRGAEDDRGRLAYADSAVDFVPDLRVSARFSVESSAALACEYSAGEMRPS